MYKKPLKFAPGVWCSLMSDLKKRGDGVRESGAFLLANRSRADRVVRCWLPYDELLPGALASNYVRLEPDAFTRLWAWCELEKVEVVADVHTHMRYPMQSISDRTYPMIAIPGHIALIVPFYAQHNPQPIDVSFNIYFGEQRWISYFHKQAERLLII